jgi:DNA-binding CsgD family transcriptional regulator
VGQFGQSDLKIAVEAVASIACCRGTEPFPVDALAHLQELADADVAAGYVETTVIDGFGRYELVTRTQPTWLFDALRRIGREDPTHAAYCHTAAEPVAISDFLSSVAFQRLRIYRDVCEPLGTADSMRLYLPAPRGTTRFFFFDRSRRAFSTRARLLLSTLRPYLVKARERYGVLSHPDPLTPRQREVLQLVAAGATNNEIARRLSVSEHTVKKHLENAYEKLGVHTRTAAVARAGVRP